MSARLEFKETLGGILLGVQAHAGARKNQVRGVFDGRLKISVTQVPERGKANQAIIRILCEFFTLNSGQIELVSGQTSAKKTFLLSGITLEQARQRENEFVQGNGSILEK